MNYPLGDNPMASRNIMEMACKRLWCAVLQQAIKDSRWDVTARSWFFSKDRGASSFLWICTVLNLKPEDIRKLLVNMHTEDATFARRSKTDIANLKLWRDFIERVNIGKEEWPRTQHGHVNKALTSSINFFLLGEPEMVYASDLPLAK